MTIPSGPMRESIDNLKNYHHVFLNGNLENIEELKKQIVQINSKINVHLGKYEPVNLKEFNKYNEKYFKKFNVYPSEITILTYDALGLIYYTWKKNGMIKSVNDFSFKNKIKGKIGTFSFKNQKVIQDLEIYKTENKKFIKFWLF